MSAFNRQLRFPALAAHVQHILYGCCGSSSSSYKEELSPAQQINACDEQAVEVVSLLASTASIAESYYDAVPLEDYCPSGMSDDEDVSSIETPMSYDLHPPQYQRRRRSSLTVLPYRCERPWELPAAAADAASPAIVANKYQTAVHCRRPFPLRASMDCANARTARAEASETLADVQWPLVVLDEEECAGRPAGATIPVPTRKQKADGGHAYCGDCRGKTK
ncbi:hypothetical protein SYNPS1DRAFT_29533 [Syncephalis pseudoplumigaleata]|uniref:Uncharacterized protein n=1 Tax=Syncephalis pseudoplumigaleata TaxID=1712513 RepID=A0A4P9YX71_9FUNG|nr:hypothetical protein SYNPS1DRAFT_29533 [Syncephalis pseudoplumigaleata]|eukprot:RKP24713.1 hypothetical protein SYNPS1DRAFT_29533 [Syncephalis pseudoplumigaleata]